jgi:hypothetical protein
MSAKPDTLAAESRSVLSAALGGWDGFWFGRMDPTTLAYIRICCGLLTFYLHVTYSWGLFSYVGPEAWIDHELSGWVLRDAPFWGPGSGWDEQYQEIGKGNWFWSIYYHVTSPGWIVALHVFFLVNMLLFTLGLATRYTGALTWLGAMSYVQRSTTTVFGVDTMMMILLLYLQIGPCGATLSLDRLIQKWWARRRGRPVPPVEPSIAANFAIRLMQVHFCIVYLASGTSKLLGSTWWSGTSMNLVMLNPAFAPMDHAPYVYLMKSLATHRLVWETVMAGNILFTLFLEVGFPFLVWDRRWRWAMLIGAVCLHTGIALFMGLTTFSLMMLAFVCCFIPPEVISQLATKVEETFARLLAALRPGAAARRAGELVMSR